MQSGTRYAGSTRITRRSFTFVKVGPLKIRSSNTSKNPVEIVFCRELFRDPASPWLPAQACPARSWLRQDRSGRPPLHRCRPYRRPGRKYQDAPPSASASAKRIFLIWAASAIAPYCHGRFAAGNNRHALRRLRAHRGRVGHVPRRCRALLLRARHQASWAHSRWRRPGRGGVAAPLPAWRQARIRAVGERRIAWLGRFVAGDRSARRRWPERRSMAIAREHRRGHRRGWSGRERWGRSRSSPDRRPAHRIWRASAALPARRARASRPPLIRESACARC